MSMSDIKDKDALVKTVTAFAESYNSAVDAMGKSDSVDALKAGLSMTNVEASQTSRTKYTYSNASSNQSAYFKAGENITCTINYTYNNVPRTLNKTFSSPAAATEYKLNVSADNNGTITTITINYDANFETGKTTSITINAATGNVVESSPTV